VSQAPGRPMMAQCWRPGQMTTTVNYPPGTTQAKLLDHLNRSWSDPCFFNEKVLRRSPYWRAQREWASALVDYRIVAVETGNGLGKGFLIGGLVPWFLWTRIVAGDRLARFQQVAGDRQPDQVRWQVCRALRPG